MVKASGSMIPAVLVVALLVPAALLAVDAEDYVLGYDDPEFWYDAAVEDYNAGSYEAATRHFKKATECGLTLDEDFYLLWGDAYYMLAKESGDGKGSANREAIRTYSGCIEYRDNWEVRAHRAQAYALQGSYDAALEDIALAIQRNREFWELWSIKGDIYTAMDDSENAANCYHNAKLYSGQDVEEPAPQPSYQSEPAPAPELVYSPEPSSRTPEQSFAQSLFDVGDRAFSESDYETAVAGYTEGLVSDPEATHYWRKLGDAFLKLGKQRASDSCYTRADGKPWPPAAPAVSTPSVLPSKATAGKDECLWNKDGSVMVRIPAGEFLMGNTADEGYPRERPQRKVMLGEFYIDKYEVTNRQFEKFVEATGYRTEAEKEDYGVSRVLVEGTSSWMDKSGVSWRDYCRPGTADHPVVMVSWNDAQAYAKWCGKSLPTEAQWEKAARGTDGGIYPWGSAAPDGSRCNFADVNLSVSWARGEIDDGYKYTSPVGHYPAGASPYGVTDMAGNVAEWCSDWHDEDYYQHPDTDKDPAGPASGSKKEVRNGSWDDMFWSQTCAFRAGRDPHERISTVGFRCVMTGEQ